MSFGTRLRLERLRRHLSQEAMAEALGISSRSIRRWEQDLIVPQGHSLLQLCRFLEMRPEELFEYREEQPSLPCLWNVPYSRNPFFTGREEILRSLHEQLHRDHALAPTKSLAISGLGGMGKTQVALEYAYRYGREYDAVFWLTAETSESLLASMQQIAGVLQLSEQHAVEQSIMIRAVQRWLAQHTGWLLIADNVDNMDLLQEMLPVARQGALLLTTRHQALGALAEPLPLLPMEKGEGIALLLHRARQHHLPASGTIGSPGMLWSDPADTPEADQVVTLLEGMPLAIDQAGAYIEETGCSLADYLQHYYAQRKQMLARRGLHLGFHPNSVTTTLRLSVERVEREYPPAGELLRFCSFVHPEFIPEGLLRAGAPHLGSLLKPVVTDRYQLDLTLAALRRASLVTRHPSAPVFSLHRLVQAVLQDEMESSEELLWGERVVRAIHAAFPEVSFETWALCEQLLPHVLACVSSITQTGRNLPEASAVLYRAGSYLVERGRYQEAEPLLEQALVLGEQQHGPDHPALVLFLQQRAYLFHQQGKYAQAEWLLQRALTLGEQDLGTASPHIAEVLNGLALVYQEQGKYEQAEPLYQRALQMLGPSHLETLNNLALLYREQGKYEQAEPLFQRTLHIREQLLGCEHPDLAQSLNNLAFLYRGQKKYYQAELLYQRALTICQQQLGNEHPTTALVLHNLANVCREQEKYEQSEQLYQQALSIRERHLGSEHPSTALTLANLARLFHLQRQTGQAELLYQRALVVLDQQLGQEHPWTCQARSNYQLLVREHIASDLTTGE